MTTSPSPLWAILPIKILADAKQRLRTFLSPDECKALMLKSTRDVLSALVKCSRLSGILLVSKDKDAIALGAEFGVQLLEVKYDFCQSDAIEQAVAYLQKNGISSTITVPGDAPLLQAADIDVVCDTLKKNRSITLVSNADGTGSNCIGTSLSGLIKYQFGAGSFVKHVASARQSGIEPVVLNLPRLELDIDTASDITRLMEYPKQTETQEFIAAYGLSQRIRGTDIHAGAGNKLNIDTGTAHV